MDASAIHQMTLVYFSMLIGFLALRPRLVAAQEPEAPLRCSLFCPPQNYVFCAFQGAPWKTQCQVPPSYHNR